MHDVIPGLDGFPLGTPNWLRSNDLSALEEKVGKTIGPRRIQLSSGQPAPDIHISHLTMGIGHLFGVQHNAAVETWSDPIASFQVMIPLRGWLIGHQDLLARPGAALIYAPGDRLRTFWSADCVGLVASICAQRLKALAFDAFCEAEFDRMPSLSLVSLADGGGRSLANMLGTICREGEARDSAYSQGVTAQAIEDTLLLSLLLTQPNGIRHSRAVLPSRSVYLRRALAHIDGHLSEPITLLDLTRAARASVRTVQYCFLEAFGIGPMAYIKRKRLRSIHAILRKAAPGVLSIGDVAAEWGFYNGSAFARAYQRTIGELPSQTLSRC